MRLSETYGSDSIHNLTTLGIIQRYPLSEVFYERYRQPEPNDIAQQLSEETESLIKASVAENTRKTYQRALQSLTT